MVELLAPVPVALDKEAWGFDHGSWGVLIKMYPNADIPMVQLSVDSTKPAAWHFEVGRKLATLRDEGVMLVASGNVVHNLRTVRWHGDNIPYPWAASFNDFVKANLTWQGPVEQHPLVNYLQHEGGSYRTRRRSTFYLCYMYLAPGTARNLSPSRSTVLRWAV